MKFLFPIYPIYSEKKTHHPSFIKKTSSPNAFAGFIDFALYLDLTFVPSQKTFSVHSMDDCFKFKQKSSIGSKISKEFEILLVLISRSTPLSSKTFQKRSYTEIIIVWGKVFKTFFNCFPTWLYSSHQIKRVVE